MISAWDGREARGPDEEDDEEDDDDDDDRFFCERCGNYCDNDDVVTIYDLEYDGDYDEAVIENEDYELTNEQNVCIDCVEAMGHYDDNVHEWIRG